MRLGWGQCARIHFRSGTLRQGVREIHQLLPKTEFVVERVTRAILASHERRAAERPIRIARCKMFFQRRPRGREAGVRFTLGDKARNDRSRPAVVVQCDLVQIECVLRLTCR